MTGDLLKWMAGGIAAAAIIYVSLSLLYYYGLLFVYATRREGSTGGGTGHRRRFGVLIPAHNEEKTIGSLLAAATQMDYPDHLCRVYVIADNCVDRTAETARSHRADVFERKDEVRRGKGYALSWAFVNTSVLENDAVVIIDADCVPERNFLSVMDDCMAEGHPVVQAYNGSRAPIGGDLMEAMLHVGNMMENRYFCYPKSLIKNGAVFLQGTGMGFESRILRNHPWSAHSIVEDLEYSLVLLLDGERIGYTMRTAVMTDEPSSQKAASTQKIRCASGVTDIIRRYFFKLLAKGTANRRWILIDAALSLLILNRSFVLGAALLAVMLAIAVGNPFLLGLSAALALLLVLYMTIGIHASGLFGWKDIGRIALYLPRHFLWAMGIVTLGFLGYRKDKWERTQR